jgi:uncharacterized protein (TIGR03382 family)
MSLSLLVLTGLSLADAPPPPPIVGGTETYAYEAVGALVALDALDHIVGSFCSGTLVGPRQVLTAAHCVDGMYDLQDMGYSGFEFVIGTNVALSSGTWERTAITAAHRHPFWGGSGMVGDLAVLELGRDVETTLPMLLNQDSPTNAWAGELITYVGWGKTDDSDADTAGTKRTVDVPFHSLYEDTMLSYDPDGGNVCYGDSGGAALVETEDEGYRLAGVNSFIFNIEGGEPSCAQDGAAAGSARVDLYRDWIETLVDLAAVEASVDAPTEPDPETEDEESPETDSEAPASAETEEDVEPVEPEFTSASGGAQETAGGCSVTGSTGSLGLALLGLLGVVRRRR